MWQFLDISSDWLYNVVAYPSRGIEATGLQTESSLQQTANYSCKVSMTEILHLHITRKLRVLPKALCVTSSVFTVIMKH